MTDLSLPQWRQDSLSPWFSTSASAMNDHLRCRRLWWATKVRKLPMPKIRAQTFGTVLHAVVERYLRADHLGRDGGGYAVELYPPGWQIARNRFNGQPEGEADETEQVQIRKLVEEAIASGIVVRTPGIQVEKEFRRVILTTAGHGFDVSIHGFIDVLLPDAVEDHKTTSSTKWMKSSAALKKEPQLLLYAKELIEGIRERGGAMPKRVTVRHIYFCKDPKKPHVRKVEAWLSPAQIDQAWVDMQALVYDMASIRRDVTDGFAEIPPPENTAQACNAYGGCPLRFVCWQGQTIEDYERTFQTSGPPSRMGLPSPTSGTPAMLATQETPMSIISSLKGAGKPQTAPGPALPRQGTAPPPFVQTQHQQFQPPQQSQPQQFVPPGLHQAMMQTPQPQMSGIQQFQPAPSQFSFTQVGVDASGIPVYAPPWAKPGCPACKGSGFLGAKACPICLATAAERGVPDPANLSVFPLDERTAIFMHPAFPAFTGKCAIGGLTAPATSRTVEAPAPSFEPQPEQDDPATAGELVAGDRPQPRSGRPAKTFMICVNVAPIDTIKTKDRNVLFAAKLLHELGPGIAAQLGAPSFYQCNPFERKDLIRAAGEKIAESIKQGFVIFENVGTGESDLKALLDAIRPFASDVICPIG